MTLFLVAINNIYVERNTENEDSTFYFISICHLKCEPATTVNVLCFVISNNKTY